MNGYILMVETGADIPSDLVERNNIVTVPMHISFGDETRDDGTFPPEEIFSYYERTGTLPQTSGCTTADFEKAFDLIHAKYPDKHILHLAYSAATTCSYQSAMIAAEGRNYVTSIDTKQVSAGQANIVLSIASYLDCSPTTPLNEVTTLVENLIRRCHMSFFPGDLVYLKAGGRVSNAAYMGARILGLLPLIELQDGKLISTKRYRGKIERMAEQLLQDCVKTQKLQRDGICFVYSAGFSPKLREHITTTAQWMGFNDILWIQTGCVVSTHCGPGAFGVVGYEPETEGA